MHKQFKKGDVVWQIGNWNSKATAYVKKLTIQSWGKKQGTATDLNKNNDFVKHTFYVDQADTLYLASEVENINVFALEVAKQLKAEHIQHYADCAHHHYIGAGAGAYDSYFNSMAEKCRAVMAEEPTVIFI